MPLTVTCYRRDAAWLIAMRQLPVLRLFTYSGRCRGLSSLLSLTRVMAVNTTDTLLLTASLVCQETLAGNYYPAKVASQWKLQFLWCIVLNLAVDVREVFSQWSAKQASLHCVGKSAGILNKYWFNWELSLSLFAVLMRTSAKCCNKVVQNAASLPHKNAIHGVTKLVIFSF